MHYIKFINLYKQNSLAKKIYYTTYISKKSKKLLEKFIELGLIKHAVSEKKNFQTTRIYINYIRQEKVYKNLINLYKPSKKKNISNKTLQIKKQFSTSSTFILLTSKGIITNFEAMTKNSGGILLCQINY